MDLAIPPKGSYFVPSWAPIGHLVDRNKPVEFVGGGFAMYITVQEHDANLKFTDDGYFFQIGTVRLPIPRVSIRPTQRGRSPDAVVRCM